MPVAYIDIPTRVDDSAKTKIFSEMYEAIHEAWPSGTTIYNNWVLTFSGSFRLTRWRSVTSLRPRIR